METKAAPSEIRALTGIRGIAALFVAVYHFEIFKLLSGHAATFFNNGYLSVDLFFVLSGFVMSMVYAPLFQNGFSVANYRTFLVRRIARIYPLFFVVTLIKLAQIYGHFGAFHSAVPLTWGVVSAHILLIQAWGISRSFVPPSWSISTEWAAYLIFPLLVLTTLSSRRVVAVVIAVICVILLTAGSLLPADVTRLVKERGPFNTWQGDNYGPLARCLLEFMLGQLAFRFNRWKPASRIFSARWFSPVIGAALMALFIFPKMDLAIVLLFPVLIISLTYEESWLAKIAGSRALHGLGVISYSLYLIHNALVFLRGEMDPVLISHHIPHVGIITLSTQTGLALFLAVVSYQIIEKPGRRLLRHWLEPSARIEREPNPNLAAP